MWRSADLPPDPAPEPPSRAVEQPDLLPPTPGPGWSVHLDQEGNFYYLTPCMLSTGTRHKISKNSHLNNLVKNGDIDQSIQDQLIYKRSVLLSKRPLSGKLSWVMSESILRGIKCVKCHVFPLTGSSELNNNADASGQASDAPGEFFDDFASK